MSIPDLPKRFPFWGYFLLTLGVWIMCFWFYLSRQSPISSDAVSFYEHTRFYLENLSHGVVPLWDPYNSLGSPHEFFLRRIGAYNPLLLLMVIPVKVGIDLWVVFITFVVFYYFLGMIGFYRIARELFKTRLVAFTSFLILTFSSLGTRLFDSYIMMVMTPMIWFFYFLIIWGRYQKLWALLGMTGCSMLLMTTYIPFYFIMIVISFALVFVCVYPQSVREQYQIFLNFAKSRPFILIFCLVSLGVSLLPGYLFFKHAGEGNLVMPLRHFNSSYTHVLGVKPEVTSYWAIPEDLLFSTFFLGDLREFNLAVFFIPLFAYVVLFLGTLLPLHRRLILFFFWGFSLFVLGSPYLFPTYEQLHAQVFFIKYFRNLHFFLWLAILPLFILFVMQQLDDGLEILKGVHRRLGVTLWVIVVHLTLAGVLIWLEVTSWSSWLTLMTSLILFLFILYAAQMAFLTSLLLFLVISLEPIEAYHHLSQNVIKEKQFNLYEHFPNDFSYIRRIEEINKISGGRKLDDDEQNSRPFYIGTIWFEKIWQGVKYQYLLPYILHKVVIYDAVQPVDDGFDHGVLVRQRFKGQEPFAWVPIDYSGPRGTIKPSPPQFVQSSSPSFGVIKSDVNALVLKTNFIKDQFVVVNYCYYPGWQLWIDQKKVSHYRSNIAFIGFWVTAGEHHIRLQFKDHRAYGFEMALMSYYVLFAFGLWWVWYKDK